MASIADQLDAVRHRIADAARAHQRVPADICLMAVSKTFPVGAVLEAVAAGQTVFGESYVQEAVPKIERLGPARASTCWHFIGPLQSNKAKLIAQHFDWVHGVDRIKIAQRLSDLRAASLPALQVCIQVNLDDEPTKAGVAPEQVLALARAVAALPRLTLRGLMAIPAPRDDPALQRAVFRKLAALRAHLVEQGQVLDTLSMGMSGDLEAAVAEGATIVRVGTAIFGERD